MTAGTDNVWCIYSDQHSTENIDTFTSVTCDTIIQVHQLFVVSVINIWTEYFLYKLCHRNFIKLFGSHDNLYLPNVTITVIMVNFNLLWVINRTLR